MSERPVDDSLTTGRALRRILGPYRGRITIVALGSFVAALLEATFLVIVTRGILALADGRSTVELIGGRSASISRAAMVGLLLLAARLVSSLVAAHRQNSLVQSLSSDLRRDLGHAFLHTTWQVQNQQPRGLLSHVIVQFPATIASLAYQLIAALAGGLGLLSLLVIAFVIEPSTAVVVIGVVFALAAALWPIRRAVRRRATDAQREQVRFATKVAEFADLSLEIAALGVPAAADTHLDRLIADESRSQRAMGFFRDLVAPTYTTLAYVAILLALVVLDGGSANDLSNTGAVLLIMLRSLSYGQQMQHGASALGQIAPAARELIGHLDTFESARHSQGTRRLDRVERIELSGVSFIYPGGPRVLDYIDLVIERGQVVGVVGPSGAGKTTLVQILLGLLEPAGGSHRVDGVPRSDIDASSWSRLVTYVPQDTRLLDGTIADNVRFMRTDVSDADIVRALTAAGLHLDPERFPLGVMTDLGAAARQFSGGQRQRLAIARALASEPSLLILDEPTSSLDAESEAAITETLNRLRGDVSVVVVTHREATLAACDRVVSLVDGRVTPRF
ncbi:MAG: ABC transporter ATP-binding protein [Acidimicrobiales bacterium mtb01]|nr:ABC transporter ATP-binding protein [Actinomycetota bacterium]TEX47789.1 MAG: ABC transporter ATP-binding protein [Acidimicrobiales bacterium mtb01]